MSKREAPSSSVKEGSAPVKRSEVVRYDNSEFGSMLRVFYERVFPFDDMHRWLTYGSSAADVFAHREFSMTFAGDVYARYQCYRDGEEFAAAIRKSCPVKIDVGAVFNARPADHKSLPAPLVPVQRELVFDIDLTDYDDVRKCCSKTQVCQKCFAFMQIAVRTLDDLLRTDFGFKHLLWVFSGRRGIHCWICDESARMLSAAQRSAVAEYISIAGPREGEIGFSTEMTSNRSALRVRYRQDDASQWSPIHPSLDRIYNLYLLPAFERGILEDHVDFEDPKTQDLLLRDLPVNVQEAFREEWTNKDTAKSYKWKQYKTTISELASKGELRRTNPTLNFVFYYCYPRLDINVSKQLNHLLKSPFCVHPSTGNVCIPLDPQRINEFDLSKVPRLANIMAQLDAGQPTDMDAAVASFRTLFLDGLEASLRSDKVKQKQATLDF